MTFWTPHILGASVAGLILAALIGGLLGLSGFTFLYAEGWSYLSDDPAACVNCHIMRGEYDSWQKASHHAAATCNGCHTPHDLIGKYATKARNGFWHSYYFTFQNFHEPIQISRRNAAVLQDNCIDCHAGLVHDIRTLGSAGDESNNCVRCHAAAGHGPVR
jgi:cytochrome c nitrite reductase small subunit